MIDESKHEDFKKDFAVFKEDYYIRSAEVFQEEFSQAEIRELTSLVEKAKKSRNDTLLQYSDVGKKLREKQSILREKLSHIGKDYEYLLSKYIDKSKYMELEVEAVEVESGSYGGSGQGTGSGTGRR